MSRQGPLSPVVTKHTLFQETRTEWVGRKRKKLLVVSIASMTKEPVFHTSETKLRAWSQLKTMHMFRKMQVVELFCFAYPQVGYLEATADLHLTVLTTCFCSHRSLFVPDGSNNIPSAEKQTLTYSHVIPSRSTCELFLVLKCMETVCGTIKSFSAGLDSNN